MNYSKHILVYSSLTSKELLLAFKEELLKAKKNEEVQVIEIKQDNNEEASSEIIIYPEGAFYSDIEVKDVPLIVSEHIIKGNIIKELLSNKSIPNTLKNRIFSFNDLDIIKKQERIVLKNCGIIDPENIKEYILAGGYEALAKVLTSMKPKEVIEIVKNSGLRGRGGGGFPTGLKWELTRKSKSDQKYILCNADEGDPGAFMDRSVLEGDPHSVIEAMIIGGYAIGASKGFIYVRAEYPIAIERLKIAIAQAKEFGLIGENIFNSGFDFDLNIRLGAGAFVCGEETALMASIEGKRGEPRTKPPFPAVKGLYGKPTVLNNVETFANIPQIIKNGATWFRSFGTEKSPGTKVFAIGGKINYTGLIEIPLGMTLKKVIYEIGGGIPNNKKFKAAQTGGPSGGCIPYSHIDIPLEYDALVKIGSMMGSGGLIVLDEDNCMVDIAKFYLEFTQEESCGKCVSCRVGTKQMLELLNLIVKGLADEGVLLKLKKLCEVVKNTSLCGLGQSSPNPIISTMNFFYDEYLAHIKDSSCPAKVCKSLIHYLINKYKCIGCGACAKICPAHCITGSKTEKYEINQDKCIKCGNCYDICPVKPIKAVEKNPGKFQ